MTKPQVRRRTRSRKQDCSIPEQSTIMENHNRADEPDEDEEISSFGEMAGGAAEDESRGKEEMEDDDEEEALIQVKTVDSINKLPNHAGGSGRDIEENGDLTTRDANSLSVTMEVLEVDCDENDNESKNSSTGSITPANAKELRAEQLDSYLNLLERDQQQLNTLMVLKEREWDAIIKLKKLKEVKIARLKRRRAMDDMFDDERVQKNRRRSSNASLKAVGNNGPTAESSGTVGNKREVETRNNIRILEKEVYELASEVFTDQRGERSLDFDGHSGLESQAEGAFLASNALKSLVSKNNRTTTGISQSSASVKVIGEGRQGPKLDVTTIIADYRLKSTQDLEKEAQRRLASTHTLPPLNQSPGISFTDLLTKMKTQYDREKDLTTSPPSTTVNNTSKTIQATKVKGAAASGGASNSSSVSKAPTTLAKLLSSNNGNSVNRSLEESSIYNHKAASNNSAGSEKNLSLANLLASSKSRDEPLKKKSDAASAPVCQGCHSNKAQFVCAGCANQWYCSRECQVAAWDDHADVCSG